LIGAFTTLPHYEEPIGSRTRFYRNTDPVVDWPDWDVQLAKTGYTDEAGRCIVVDANMPDGQVIIALLGARSSRARSADLVTIRRWLDGDETPVVCHTCTTRARSITIIKWSPRRIASRRRSQRIGQDPFQVRVGRTSGSILARGTAVRREAPGSSKCRALRPERFMRLFWLPTK
jgi:hypothetical protein